MAGQVDRAEYDQITQANPTPTFVQSDVLNVVHALKQAR